ncbi:LysR family transcriptional regulator [Streptomyces beijiangensis]|uniref:LysR family transcriptional regulator n=1 Tax=Streptomyces beijiangensis TaxID=163361 RepID=A0A939JJ92_9ACTN|nr:LysR family transcriptional regulator [Streptomyces beijiangensis]MBO0514502.1 LysR family transcriptional regulator [Streptomyces beijiangensis]
MQLQQLRTFREVAAQLSFTQAARNLHYAQSSVTAHIKNLEESIGTPLFHRAGRQVSLTEAGARLLPHADTIIKIAETARRDVAASVDPGAQVPPHGCLPAGHHAA